MVTFVRTTTSRPRLHHGHRTTRTFVKKSCGSASVGVFVYGKRCFPLHCIDLLGIHDCLQKKSKHKNKKQGEKNMLDT